MRSCSPQPKRRRCLPGGHRLGQRQLRRLRPGLHAGHLLELGPAPRRGPRAGGPDDVPYRLTAAGVKGYSSDQLCDDYALMLRLMIFDPVHNAVAGSSESYWRTKMMCLVPAYLQWCVGDDELVPGLER